MNEAAPQAVGNQGAPLPRIHAKAVSRQHHDAARHEGANAVFHATGVRLRTLPIRLEQLL